MLSLSTARLVLLLPLAHATKGFSVDVGDRHVWSVVPRGFASMTMDFHPGAQGPTWGANASILEVDLSSAALRGYASALAPGVLRLGGSEAGSEVMYTESLARQAHSLHRSSGLH